MPSFSWVFLWGEKMPLPTAAELTDPNATNAQMKQNLVKLVNSIDRSYKSLADANADIANIPVGVSVKVLSVENGGDYYKATAGATSLTKSPYDPLTQAKSYMDNKVAGAVDDKVSELFVTSYNLFNPATAKKDTLVSGTDGQDSPQTGSYASDYIKVMPNTKYTLTAAVGVEAFRNVAFYREDKSFISRMLLSGRDWSSPYTLSINSDTHYIRVSILGVAAENNRMIYKGTDVKAYLPYIASYPRNITIEGSTKLAVEEISRNEVDRVNSTFLEKSKNLFNYKDTQAGVLLDLDTGNVIPNETTERFWVSGFIEVEANTTYTLSALGRADFTYTVTYDKDKKRSRSITTSSPTSPRVFTTKANEKYVRFSLRNYAVGEFERMFNKGDVPLPYEPFEPKLKDVRFTPDVINYLNNTLDINKEPDILPITDLPVDKPFRTSMVWDYVGFNETQSSTVYSMYDSLMAMFPDYITKIPLGNDAFGNEMAYYKAKPLMPDNLGDEGLKYPTIALFCAQHGAEKVQTLASYLLLEQMCNNWKSDPLLEALRFNVNFIIFPVINPSGFNAFTRENGNGIDLNRQYPPSPSDTTGVGGDYLHELESLAVKKVLDDNPDIDAAYDCHNFFNNARNNYIWMPTSAGKRVERMCQAFITRMTRSWRKDFEWFPAEPYFVGYTEAGNSRNTTLKAYLHYRGIKFSATYEVCQVLLMKPSGRVMYDADHCKFAFEAMVNWMLINVNEICKG